MLPLVDLKMLEQRRSAHEPVAVAESQPAIQKSPNRVKTSEVCFVINYQNLFIFTLQPDVFMKYLKQAERNRFLKMSNLHAP